MSDDTTLQRRAETAEAAAFRLQLTIYFLVKDVRAHIARERRYSLGRKDQLAELEQSAGIAEAVLREDEPWRAVAMRIALLEERVALGRAWIRQVVHLDTCALQNGGPCTCGRSDLLRKVTHETHHAL